MLQVIAVLYSTFFLPVSGERQFDSMKGYRPYCGFGRHFGGKAKWLEIRAFVWKFDVKYLCLSFYRFVAALKHDMQKRATSGNQRGQYLL